LRLYILGAGCSRNYSQGETEITGLKSPLDDDFFKMAKRLLSHKQMDRLFWMRLENLLQDLTRLYGDNNQNLCFGRGKENKLSVLGNSCLGLEKVMTEFYIRQELFERPIYEYGWQGISTSRGYRRLFTLIELIARTFEEALKGPSCEVHKSLAKRVKEEDQVFSYNYDLLIDHALRDEGKLTDEGYELTFNRVNDEGQWQSPEVNESKVKLLKLHGSLNWIRCSICGSNLLLRRNKIGRWSTSLPISCPKCHSKEQYMQRLIVPPLQAKNYADPAISYLWFKARRALRLAQEIVIIGYSLPPTDFAAEALLRVGIPHGKRNSIPISIINPDPKVVERFSQIFNPQKIVSYPSIETFFERA
jgi:NAD-dependent SIR2 family protein deacetylase